MSWSLERLRGPATCERLIRETSAFVARACTRTDAITRRSSVFPFTPIESFAFALQCPGGPATRAPRKPGEPSRWIRYTMGWRSLEDDCFDGRDDRPLQPITMDDAIALHERFLRETWPGQIETDLARATFPHPERHA